MLNILLYNDSKYKGCLLADEMGLGKTITVLGLIACLF
jgi:SNF2 family DNA or RNA helicase